MWCRCAFDHFQQRCREHSEMFPRETFVFSVGPSSPGQTLSLNTTLMSAMNPEPLVASTNPFHFDFQVEVRLVQGLFSSRGPRGCSDLVVKRLHVVTAPGEVSRNCQHIPPSTDEGANISGPTREPKRNQTSVIRKPSPPDHTPRAPDIVQTPGSDQVYLAICCSSRSFA